MERGKAGEVNEEGNDVVLQILDTGSSSCSVSNVSQVASSLETELQTLKSNVKSVPSASEIAKLSLEPIKQTSTVSVSKPVFLPMSEFSKPKSRFIEPPFPKCANLVEHSANLGNSNSAGSPISKLNVTSRRDNMRSSPLTPKTPVIGSAREEDEDDDEVYKTASIEVTKKKGRKWNAIKLLELAAFLCFTGFFISSLTIRKLQNSKFWSLELWKWCVLIMVIFCGRLVTEWFMNVMVFLIERNSLFRKKVLYFVYGVKTSVQVCIWLGLVLLAWVLLFHHGVRRSKKTTKTLNDITRALVAFLIGACIWLVKTFSVKLLASSFHVTRFFDRIQESVFHQYVLRALSGPPLMDMYDQSNLVAGKLSFKNSIKGKKEEGKEQVIDIDKLKRIKQDKISAWTMKGLINVISGSGLSTFSRLDLNGDDEEDAKKDKAITCEFEAKAAAYQIFQNVAKPTTKYIEEDDLLRFMKKEEVNNVLPLFEGFAETRKIKRKTLKNWLVNVYLERKSLAHSLNDTKTAIDELNKLLSVILFVVLIVVWLLFMGFLSTQVLVFISSQLLLIAFMFGNTAKMVFEAIIFVFVMHPYDVGDRCVIDGVQMVVEEMNILTTVFLRYDNEKIFYPNSVLATKPISNFYRSPEMGDSVEFSVAASTSIETIGSLKARIKTYLESKPQHWRPGHSVVVKDIEEVNKMKMALYITHTINFQNYGDKTSRRSELVLEMKKYFEELGIKYHLLPQEIHLTYLESTTAGFPPPTR